MVAAVTYDCWNTLLVPYDDTAAIEHRIGVLAETLSIPVEDARAQLTEGWQRHRQAWLRSESFVSAHIAAWLLARHGRSDDAEALTGLTRAFEEASLLTGAGATDGAAETLANLRESGIRTAVVCDAGFSPGRVIRELFARNGLAEHIDAWAFSDEVEVCKPQPEVFRHALDQLGVAPGDAVHVGDLWRTDVMGGRGMGMRTVRYTGVADDVPPPGEPDADHVLADHRDLLHLIAGGIRGAD